MESKQIEEIESLCLNCKKNGLTKILLTSIPYFKEVAIMSFECGHCNTNNNELQPVSDIQMKGVRYKVSCTKDEDLQRQIVKTEWSEIIIPENLRSSVNLDWLQLSRVYWREPRQE